MKKEDKGHKPDNLRASLKEVLKSELELLPDQLNKLEPKERLAILSRLLPYVIPKETIQLKDLNE